MHEGQIREADYWIAIKLMSEVGTDRLINEDNAGWPEDSFVSHNGDFEVNPSADWEPVKPIHEVLNTSTCPDDAVYEDGNYLKLLLPLTISFHSHSG